MYENATSSEILKAANYIAASIEKKIVDVVIVLLPRVIGRRARVVAFSGNPDLGLPKLFVS